MLLLLATGIVLPPAIRFYVQHLEPLGDRHDGFERWCAARPLVLAVRSPTDGADATLAKLATGVARSEGWVNHAGGFPWPTYRVFLAAERLGDDVLGVRITACRLARGRGRIAPVAELIDGVATALGTTDELWLHGHLHRDDDVVDPDVSWRGHVDRDRRLLLSAARELPYWLLQTMGKGPPDKGHPEKPDHDDLRAGVYARTLTRALPRVRTAR